MRAKHVTVGRRVRIANGDMRGELGTIDGVQEGKNGMLISVRPDGETRGFIFSANELHLINNPVRSAGIK